MVNVTDGVWQSVFWFGIFIWRLTELLVCHRPMRYMLWAPICGRFRSICNSVAFITLMYGTAGYCHGIFAWVAVSVAILVIVLVNVWCVYGEVQALCYMITVGTLLQPESLASAYLLEVYDIISLYAWTNDMSCFSRLSCIWDDALMSVYMHYLYDLAIVL